MKVPFQLRKRRDAEPATALLLTSHESAAALDFCAGLGADPLPRLFLVADGFLLLLPAPTTTVFPRTVRLRRLAEHLLLPVDADLLPALHEDESRALTRERGLIFLPGGRVLAFPVKQPVSVGELLATDAPKRENWRPFPPRPPRAERITSIDLDLPRPPAAAILDTG